MKSALDVAETARNDRAVDRAIAAGSRKVDTTCRRLPGIFAPTVATRYFDWPDLGSPGLRLWLDENLLISLTSITTGGQTIPPGDVILRPYTSPPYTALEVNRSTSSGFGLGSTAQRDIAVTGVWGWDLNTEPAGTLGTAIADASTTSVVVSDAGAVGVGDLLTVPSTGERMQVTGRAMRSTGLTVAGGGLTAASSSQTLVLSGTGVQVGEVLLIDSERLLVVDGVGASLTVRRAWDGTTLAAHTAGAAVNASRTLTVVRGALGTTAAAASNGAALTRHVYPGDIAQLAVAEAVAGLQSEGAGWNRTSGSAESQRDISGSGLDELRDSVFNTFGRKFRVGAV